ncbi:MAG: YesL family protein, partial [Bifidobacterium adolescentis]
MRFNINAPFWRFMDTLLRFVGLNLVYLITLIPNVTIGPARAALYSTMFAYDEHDDIRLVKEYLTRFKREFKQGLAAWVLVAILATAILFGLSFWKAWDTNASYIPLILLVIAAVVVALFAEYAAPLQARFANTTGRLFSLSAMFPWRAFPCSLVLVVIDVLAAGL